MEEDQEKGLIKLARGVVVQRPRYVVNTSNADICPYGFIPAKLVSNWEVQYRWLENKFDFGVLDSYNASIYLPEILSGMTDIQSITVVMEKTKLGKEVHCVRIKLTNVVHEIVVPSCLITHIREWKIETPTFPEYKQQFNNWLTQRQEVTKAYGIVSELVAVEISTGNIITKDTFPNGKTGMTLRRMFTPFSGVKVKFVDACYYPGLRLGPLFGVKTIPNTYITE
jgi:hypothetical protein